MDAGAEVNNALTQWQTARKSLELDRRKVETLETAVRSTQLLMEYGNTNYLEVLTARQTLLQAQLTEVSDKYEEIQGVIGLYHALGWRKQVITDKKDMDTQAFENMPVTKAVLVNAVPAVLSMLVTLVYNVADTFFIGQTEMRCR